MTVGDAAILDLSDVPENTAITGERIAAAGAYLRRGDIAILRPAGTSGPMSPRPISGPARRG